MKPAKINYLHIVLFAILTEFALILVQFGFLNLYVFYNPGQEIAFTEDYMKSVGFFVFQTIGLFTYLIVIFSLCKKIDTELFKKVLLFVIVGGLLELSFYLLIMQAKYEGAYLYSIFGKFIGAAFGIVINLVVTRKIKSKDSFV